MLPCGGPLRLSSLEARLIGRASKLDRRKRSLKQKTKSVELRIIVFFPPAAAAFPLVGVHPASSVSLCTKLKLLL